MNGSELAVPGHTTLRILVTLLYLLVGGFSIRWLLPNLSPFSKRAAGILLAAQALVMILALNFRSSWTWAGWLWDLNMERNIAATLASAQLAVIGGVALSAAWLRRDLSAGRRFFMVAIGLIFLFFAVDEYFAFHENRGYNWKTVYTALGLVVASAAALLALRSNRRERRWFACLLAGLAIMAFGAIVFDIIQYSPLCVEWGFSFYGWCRIYALEEALEFLGAWLILIAMLGFFSGSTSKTRRKLQCALCALPALWILALIHYPAALMLDAALAAQPAAVTFENSGPNHDILLHGYKIDKKPESISVQLYFYARNKAYFGQGSSLHLVDQATGRSIASNDDHWDSFLAPRLGLGFRYDYRQWLALDIEPEAPANRALWLVLTLWKEGEGDDYVKQRILSSDHFTLSDTQVILAELVIPAESPIPPGAAAVARFENGFSLDAVDLPARAQAGQSLRLPFAWRANVDSSEDFTQLLHFVSEESGAQWGYDQQPLGARLPTRLWYGGLYDSETWDIPIPADLAPGAYTVYTGLYRSSDQARASVSGADGMPIADARVPLGTIVIN
ncbi:MAG: hypothetical protein OXN88_00600 [Chloroflexota bacterium]|nr:hypothetical protein [Chloroflexota bacterium]